MPRILMCLACFSICPRSYDSSKAKDAPHWKKGFSKTFFSLISWTEVRLGLVPGSLGLVPGSAGHYFWTLHQVVGWGHLGLSLQGSPYPPKYPPNESNQDLTQPSVLFHCDMLLRIGEFVRISRPVFQTTLTPKLRIYISTLSQSLL